jgi:hypothetical protein
MLKGKNIASATLSFLEHSWFVAALFFLGLGIRMFAFTDKYAVNIFIWDQWDFYGPLFRHEGLWAAFDYQHGPHRQGIGFLVTEVIAQLSGWNARADAFGVAGVLVAGCIAGLVLAHRCGVRGWALALVPLFFFNIRQYEMFVMSSNISHGAMPMLLCASLVLCWLIPRPAVRAALISLLTFFSIFTGFAVFLGLIIPFLLLVELFQHWRAKRKHEAVAALLALLAIGASWALFLHDYHFVPAVDNYRFPYEKPHEYFLLIAAMLNNFHGLKCNTPLLIVTGFVFFAIQLVLLCGSAWRIVRSPETKNLRDVAIFVMSAFALLYGANTAIGRVFAGWQNVGLSSRYVTLMISSGMAILLYLGGGERSRWRHAVLLGYLIFISYGTIDLRTGDWRAAAEFRDGRAAWRKAYLETHHQGKANALAKFQVYPVYIDEEKLNFLREHHLNLFSEDGAKP